MSERKRAYSLLLRQMEALIDGERDETAVLSNASALLRDTFPERFFWVGFYLVKLDALLLGPFQGSVACFRIERGKGVCGAAWARGATIVVPDVERFAGHIACSDLSRSEIVTPMLDRDGTVWGVIDVDSAMANAFDETDKEGLESVATLLSAHLRP